MDMPLAFIEIECYLLVGKLIMKGLWGILESQQWIAFNLLRPLLKKLTIERILFKLESNKYQVLTEIDTITPHSFIMIISL